MSIDSRFASKLARVEDAPEPLREALRRQQTGQEPFSFLAYAPAFVSAGAKSPATLLAVNDQRWFVISEKGENGAESAGCAFEDTLLVELTGVLLLGRLKVHFVSNGGPSCACVQFNTVMEGIYREAVELMLGGIERGWAAASSEARPAPALDAWPMKWRNAVLNGLPKGRRLLAAAHWDALGGGFGRELAQAAALALTDREVLLITEEGTDGRRETVGHTATYFPLNRLAKSSVSHHARFSILRFEAHAPHGSENLEVIFPLEDQGVLRLVEETAKSDV